MPSNIQVFDCAVASAKQLRTIELPDGITNIPRLTFSNCISLENITLPKTIQTIENSAFHNCVALRTVYFKGTKADWSTIQIDTTSLHILDYYKIDKNLQDNIALLNAQLICLDD